MGWFDCLHLSSFVLFHKVLSRVLLLTRLSLALIAPYWPQKYWFVDILALSVTEPLELPLLWNLLVQPHVQKFHWGLGTLQLHAWKLSIDLSKRLAFCEVL